MCNVRGFNADCDISTIPMSTNPGLMKGSMYALTRETCFVARRLEVIAVAGPQWTSWRV